MATAVTGGARTMAFGFRPSVERSAMDMGAEGGSGRFTVGIRVLLYGNARERVRVYVGSATALGVENVSPLQ